MVSLQTLVRRDKTKRVTHLLRNANVMVAAAESSCTITQRHVVGSVIIVLVAVLVILVLVAEIVIFSA